MNPDGFSRPKQAAEFCGVSLPTYWRWARDGIAPKPIPVSRGVSLVRNSELLDWQADPAAWRLKNATTTTRRGD